jgi:hypothetical protein
MDEPVRGGNPFVNELKGHRRSDQPTRYARESYDAEKG